MKNYLNFLGSETFFNLLAFVKLEFCCIQIIFVAKVLVYKIEVCKFEMKKDADFLTSSGQKSLHEHIYDEVFLRKLLTAKSRKNSSS